MLNLNQTREKTLAVASQENQSFCLQSKVSYADWSTPLEQTFSVLTLEIKKILIAESCNSGEERVVEAILDFP